MQGKLYLIPATLGDEGQINHVLPELVLQVANTIDEFLVEDEKSARRFLKKLGIEKPLQELVLIPLNEHTAFEELNDYFDKAATGKNIGIISEAGCPGVADPGAEAVRLAHQKNIKVIPLVGPSSILLALMASGMNGQHFAFNGYLPKERQERIAKIKELERLVTKYNQTQLFIETPYRNNHLLEDLIATCHPDTALCVACDITLPTEFIITKTIQKWKQHKPDINKRPAIFVIGN